MNRFRSGTVPLFALLVLVGCSSEPTDSLRGGPTELVATPTHLFLELGGVKNVEVGSLDAQGNPIDLNYEVTATGPGITVRRDSSFLPIFVNDSTLQAPAVGPRFRFIVEGTGYAASSFTVSAGGLDLVVPVQVVPQTGFAGTFDKPVSVLGDTITLTAAPGTAFTDTAELRLPGVADTIPLHPVIVARGANGSSLSFLAPPNLNGPLIITSVTSLSAPGLVFSPATDATLETPLIDTVDVSYSTTTPALGATVTMTSDSALINMVVDSIIFPGQFPGREGDPQNIVVALDSSSLTFATPPNIDGSGTVVNFAFPGGFLLPLPTRPNVTSDSIPRSLPVTFSDTLPDVSETVTMTAPAGFTFDDTTNVTVGPNAAIVVARAADGSTVGFVPIPGSVGIPQIDGVVPAAAPLNILTMPAEATVAVAATVPTLPGSDAPGTAPSLSTPALGESTVLFDNPDFEATVDHFYQLVVPANATFTITLDWNIGGDVDYYICGDGCDDPFDTDLIEGTTTAGVPSFFPGATSAHPEAGIYTLTAGTYWLLAEDFGGDAAGTTLVITLRRTS